MLGASQAQKHRHDVFTPCHPPRVFLTTLPASIVFHKPQPDPSSGFPNLLDRVGLALWAIGFCLEVLVELLHDKRYGRLPSLTD